MDFERLEAQLAELPLFGYFFLKTGELTFSERIRYICQHECQMYGKTWACPPAVGSVEDCRRKCQSYPDFLMICTVTEVEDISDIDAALATRGDHEEVTRQAEDMVRQQGMETYTLSTEACAECDRCAWLDGEPCRMPERMHPCIESHGINVIPVLEQNGLDFQYGSNIVTWYSLLFFND